MSNKNKWLQRFFAVLTVLVFMTGISVLTAYADPGDDGGQAVADDGGEIDGGNADSGDADTGNEPADSDNADSGEASQPADSDSGDGTEQGNADNGAGSNENNISDDSNNVPQTSSAPDTDSDALNRIRDYYINNVEDLPDNISQYTPDKNLSELPTVAPEEVPAATAEPLPDVEVSDATLFSGIIMWVCVAVGISVVAGVMVSKRTHRRGA